MLDDLKSNDDESSLLSEEEIENWLDSFWDEEDNSAESLMTLDDIKNNATAIRNKIKETLAKVKDGKKKLTEEVKAQLA